MAVGYPPQPVYPLGIDSDFTLFLVYNTTESELAEDNEPWAEEITIVPRGKTQSEVWADNGFANINGELLYYDAVSKDANGKVYKLRKCARNLGDVPTQFNTAGTMVRGFVVAEHHNQLVDGIILTEQFIGFNFTTDKSTVDWRIRNLNEVPIIFDDYGCPDIIFDFKVVSTDPSAGTVIEYSVNVAGSYSEFMLSFGDGETTSSIQGGTHTYAPNANIDPAITITSKNCQIVQTPSERDSVDAPQSLVVPTAFTIPNLPGFIFPNINIQSPSIPEPDITLPPFQFPCVDFSPFGISPINIPSVITFEPSFPLPSIIEFQPIVPSIITISPSVILASLVAPNISINIPTLPISVAWTNPPDISVAWGSPPNVGVTWAPVPEVTINWGSPPTVPIGWGSPPNVSMNWGTPPQVNINWGTPPTVQVNVTVTCPSTPLALAATDPLGLTSDMLGVGKDIQVEYDISGFPSEVRMIPPDIPDVRIVHDLPSEVFVRTPVFPDIKFEIPEFRDIKILPPETQLTIEAIGIPDSIKLESTVKIPERIELFVPVKIPEKITIEHNLPSVIRVEGLPDVIRLEHNLPTFIELKLPEKPEIELVYKGSPIPVQIQLDIQKLADDENYPCVALIPCHGRK
jgi:hypothetical protein